MPIPSSNVREGGERQPAACAICDETARRDEALLDALQMAMIALTKADGFDDWRIRSARARASISEAMRLMQVRTW